MHLPQFPHEGNRQVGDTATAEVNKIIDRFFGNTELLQVIFMLRRSNDNRFISHGSLSLEQAVTPESIAAMNWQTVVKYVKNLHRCIHPPGVNADESPILCPDSEVGIDGRNLPHLICSDFLYSLILILGSGQFPSGLSVLPSQAWDAGPADPRSSERTLPWQQIIEPIQNICIRYRGHFLNRHRFKGEVATFLF
jgi:hypothetical protein